MNQEAICPPPSAGCGGSGRSSGSCCSNGCLHNSPSTARTQNDAAPHSHPHPCALCSPTAWNIYQKFICVEFASGVFCGRFESWLSIVTHRWLFPPSRPPSALSPPPSWSARPRTLLLFPAPASNGLNRLASCQSRGLLWLCHKSARKNRNHLFRLGPESEPGCKYISLGLALSPASALRSPHRAHRKAPALQLSVNQLSHQQLVRSLDWCGG